MVRGVLLWLLGITVGSYLILAAAWFEILSQREYNYVTLVDCLLAPVRWDEIKRKRGDAYVDEGLVVLQERKWGDGILKIQAGLAQSPENWRGRRNLAMVYVAAGKRETGLKLLIEAFDHRYQGREVLEFVTNLCLQGEDFDVLLEVLDTSLASSGAAVDRDCNWLIDQKCRVLMMAERHLDTLAWIDAQAEMTEVRHESKVVSLIELSRYDEAEQALQEWSNGSGALGGVRRLSIRLARERGNIAKMRSELTKMQDNAPLDPSPWTYGIIQEFLAGEHEMAARVMEGFLIRFDGKIENLIPAAVPLSEIGAWELFDRFFPAARCGYRRHLKCRHPQ